MSEPKQQNGWQDDWLYALIFAHAEDSWEMCRRSPDPKYWQFVLISEWSAADDAMCQGEPIRAWIRNEDGLNQISIDEFRQQEKQIRGRLYPFILVQFHVSADRKHIVYGHMEASTAGAGVRYIVAGTGDGAKLTHDPNAGFWVS